LVDNPKIEKDYSLEDWVDSNDLQDVVAGKYDDGLGNETKPVASTSAASAIVLKVFGVSLSTLTNVAQFLPEEV
jgi:hypothetical protein